MFTKKQPTIVAGDHIKVWRPAQGGYFHHGIYCEDSLIIHYSGEPQQKKHACISQTSLKEFADGSSVKIVTYSDCLPSYYTIKRAKGRLGEREYNLFFNNCEHFARWCKTGYSKSQQVNTVLYLVSKALLRHPIVHLVAEGIYIFWDNYVLPNPKDPEYLSPDLLLLFQIFRQAYEQKNIQALANTISENFQGSAYYGTTKEGFIRVMQRVFDLCRFGTKPSLNITVYDILSECPTEIQVIIDMKAHLNMFSTIPLPFTQYDSAKLLCIAKYEDSDWRITQVTKLVNIRQ